MPAKASQPSGTRTRSLLITVGLLMAVVAIGVVFGVVAAAVVNVPTWNPESLTGSVSTILYDENDKVFYQLHAEENRIIVPLNKMPKDLKNAFFAIEDQQFYEHHGVNIKSIARAIFVDVISGSKRQGASTITQQLARNAFLKPEKTFERKIKEVVMSMQLESRYTKDEILEFYLNRIYFGAGAWGVETAAHTYFGKNVSELNLSECALLAGLVKSPNTYSPFRNYSEARRRQRLVLNNMAECGFITQSEADRAYEEPVNLKKTVNSTNRYGYYVDTVIDEADEILRDEGLYDNPQDAIFRGGLKIYTTVNTDVQDYAEEIYSDSSRFPNIKSRRGQIIQSAMVLEDQKTGGIVALIGGRDNEQQRGFNRATDAVRQPGSAFKPVVVYGPALEEGYTPDYTIDDSPVSYTAGDGSWTPHNYDNKYRGLISMRTAVQFSINVAAVKLADTVGIRNGVAFAQKLGISTLVTGGRYNDMNLSTALGGLTRGVKPVEMAGAYSAYANGGLWNKPHTIEKILDQDGNVLYERRNRPKQVMKKETAWMMTSMLQSVVEGGTGTRARISGVSCAGKTGTTSDSKDAWFCGYTPAYTCVVWMGFDKKETMDRTAGGTYPALLWRAVMTKAVAGKKNLSFSMPTGLSQVAVCQKSGKLATSACPEEDIRMEYRDKETTPTENCDLHVLINICPDSGKLATPSCPYPVPRGFLKEAPPGDPEAAPTEECDIHKPGQAGSAVTVKVCRDPRNQGRLYLANEAKDGASGGCPSDETAEIQVNNPEFMSYCPLPDHQIVQDGQ
ncbi:MAG: transglycosylase domain-containing protein [Solirubrobacterales bacterium]